MEALSPRGGRDERCIMGLKLMIGAGYLMSLTGAGSSAWILYAQASGQSVVTENTWIPLGAAVAVFGVGMAVTIKAVRLWDGREQRITNLEDKMDRILDKLEG